jgi:hypothetical protein
MSEVESQEVEERALPLCPRCGAPYRHLEYKTIYGRTYVYAYHGKQGKKPILCYLGPADGYAAVEHVLQLNLHNINDIDLPNVAYNAASLYAARMRHRGTNEKSQAAERLKQLAEDIKLLAEDLARA